MNDSAQWIVLLGFLVSLSLFFLALLINQSTLVGQTTAEGVLEFPKNDIRDTRDAIISIVSEGGDPDSLCDDIRKISLERKNTIVNCTISGKTVVIHYNNGVTLYEETVHV